MGNCMFLYRVGSCIQITGAIDPVNLKMLLNSFIK